MKSLKTFNLSVYSSLEMFLEIAEGMEELEEFNLSWSKIKELPLSINNLTGLSHLNLRCCVELKSLSSSIRMKSLKTFNLSGCSSLEMFPEISGVIEGLEELNLCGSKIKELPSSINKLTRLCYLVLSDCNELKRLPRSICMKSLKTFNLSGSSLEMFPEISEVIEGLEKLDISWSEIQELPLSINNLTRLRHLNLNYCKELKCLPSSICQLKFLVCLSLSGCIKFEVFPSIEENMEGLRELSLNGTSIKELSPWIERLTGLEKLDLSGSKIEELPSSINNLTGLGYLGLDDCKELKCPPSSIRMKSLKFHNLSNCSSLEKFPEILEVIEGLKELDLSGSKIRELPSSINNLTGLCHLNLNYCKELKSLPSSICQLKSLVSLSLSGCTKFEVFPSIEENMERLRVLL
ncbi:disease resistance protein RPV1-like [Pyrus x bretschneideri]|uniref:disease resistance protein RPV1-like n=1 Tax=Pyrus x bretschneideri TaxID=225117 RepID=UPI00202EB507|nr:disease resistance protein RPV1-like [Pyrus x bretschneideri]XP_048421109.1 disease resistance protein RPV1-like [Pyrus x bretschneideri]XP_048421110.1 disease resistance protein RPV1-like [Pyrus x bretschneideri]XP_048421111.1 disease resistance protein RPV1-like [Pyrus x bretschneideri]XP_048421112.1 disease resistance protein RPV1-like [Pyrus x bretschneideri]XP_048421113.1 disease resistance protein RPV1-like [Pyrus x bretschneideri]